MSNSEIFISYARNDESQEIADTLYDHLGKRGHKVILDRKDLGYRGNIEEFEHRLGKGDYIVTIISDKFLKSEHCMNEMRHIERREAVYKRIFPIVLEDAREIYKPAGRLKYQAHWKKEVEKFEQAIKRHGLEPGIEYTVKDLTKWENIRLIIGKIVDLIAKMNTLSPDIHEGNDFAVVLNAIEKQMLEEQYTPTNEIDNRTFLVPYTQNKFLKNGDYWTKKIKEKLSTGYQTAVCQTAAVGQGGIGKTAMAIEYAHKYSSEYPGGVFWLGMETGLSGAAQTFLKTAEEQGLIQPGWKETDEKAQTNLLLSQLQKDGMKLIILDNLETGKIPEQIARIHNSHQLVTTRNQTMTIEQVDMELPDPKTSLDIFLGYAKQDRLKINDQELKQAKKICKKVEYLPLALEILGSFSRGYPLEKIAADLPKELIEKERPTCNKECTSVLASLNLAGYQFSGPKTKDVLCSIAYLDPESISSELLADILEMPEKDILEILANLTDLSILKKTTTGYGVHRLTQEAICFLDEDITWGKNVVNHISKRLDEVDNTGHYIDCYELIPHIFHISHLAREDQPDEDFPGVISITAWVEYLINAGNYFLAEPIAEKCLKRVELSKKSEDHPDIATALNNMAWLYESQGKYDLAEPLYKRALKIRESALGKSHPDVATTLNNMAWLYESQGKYDQTEPLYKRALKIRESALGKSHPDVATTLNNMAWLYEFQGKYGQAEPLYKRALKIRDAALGKSHPDIAITLNNLAGLYKNQGKYDQAEPLYKRAFKIREAALGKSHPDVATTLNNLAGFYYSQGKYDQAEFHLKRALKAIEVSLGYDHPNTKIIQNNYEKLKNKIFIFR